VALVLVLIIAIVEDAVVGLAASIPKALGWIVGNNTVWKLRPDTSGAMYIHADGLANLIAIAIVNVTIDPSGDAI
jgi:hypothetical protein